MLPGDVDSRNSWNERRLWPARVPARRDSADELTTLLLLLKAGTTCSGVVVVADVIVVDDEEAIGPFLLGLLLLGEVADSLFLPPLLLL